MVHLEAACDSTVDGKKFKKGDRLPPELASYSLAKVVEDDSKVKETLKIKETVKSIEIPKEEPKKVEVHGKPKKR